MTAEAAFLRAICERPADDAARLVFADWLEEHGGEPERAEFIRAQCGGDVRRADVLFGECYREWSPPGFGEATRITGGGPCVLLVEYRSYDPSPFTVEFRRGFVEVLRLPLALFIKPLVIPLFSVHPITTVRVTDFLPTPSTPGGSRWRFPWFEDVPADWRTIVDPLYGRAFRSRDLAERALSDRLVAYGRDLVRLPAL